MSETFDLDTRRTTAANERSFTVALPTGDVAGSIARSMVRRITTFVSDDAESSFLVALTEVVANAIDEHRRADVTTPVTVIVEYGGDDTVYVVDNGRGIDLHHLSPPDVNVSSESGRGLALARAFVADMSFDTTDSGTTVTLPLTGLGIIR